MIVLVHGYEGSGAGHWQHWLRDTLEARGVKVAFPDLPEALDPKVDAWVDGLRAVLATRGDAKVTLVAHSLGCWAVDHLVARDGTDALAGALLVAPPSPYSLFGPIQDFLPPPRNVDAWAPIAGRTLVLGSDDDEYASDGEFVDLAGRLGVAHRILPGGGHLNAAAGFGPFPFVMDWLSASGAL